MSDLQHEDASRNGSQERMDAGEDSVESGYMSPARPVAAAPDTERSTATASSLKNRRAAAGGLVEAARRYVGNAPAARVWSPGVRGPGRRGRRSAGRTLQYSRQERSTVCRTHST